jgi:ABC-type multidrug transport system fused ATPase/permease subunit
VCAAQEPVLHAGTVQHNIDPFDEQPTDTVREALTRARLPESMLHMVLEKGGANLSSGERQLLCFARALLNVGTRPVLILDEATSNLDAASDAAVQSLLRSEFAGRTVLTIAHRLTTIIDYHRLFILVRCAGCTPALLSRSSTWQDAPLCARAIVCTGRWEADRAWGACQATRDG